MKERHTVIELITGSSYEYPRNCVEQHLTDGYVKVDTGRGCEVIYPLHNIIVLKNYDVEVDLDDLEAPDVPCEPATDVFIEGAKKVLNDGILGRVDTK